jgi:hypothetical protein
VFEGFTAPVAAPLEVEALIAQEQAGTAVVAPASTEAEASGEAAEAAMAATPVEAGVLAEAQA